MKLAAVIILLTLGQHATAQQETYNIMKGYLGVEGGESFTYKIEFRDSAGFIDGYSYTYMLEKQEVKTAITGRIDRNAKTMALRETEVIYNHGFNSHTTVCLIDVLLSYKEADGQMALTGPFKSADISNIYCGKGTITFTGTNAVNSLFLTPPASAKPVVAAPPAPPKKPLKVVYDTVAKRPPAPQPATSTAPAGPYRITAGSDKEYQWNTDVITFDIWDGGRIDGDVVTVLYDGETVLKSYTLAKGPKQLSFTLPDSKVHTITIIANNEGGELPNTANIKLRDGGEVHQVIAYNAIGKRAVIRIRKK